jgi:hypothetical protein
MSEEFRTDYPLREGGFLKPLGGFDIYRSPNLIMAIVAVESKQERRDIRFYRWQLRTGPSGQEAWKVDLARFSVRRFDFNDIAEKVEHLRTKFGIPAK